MQLRLFVFLAVTACSSGDDPPVDSGPGELKVTTVTTGSQIDPDGYSLLLNNQVSISLLVNGSGIVSLLPGDAIVDIINVMGNCSVAPPRIRTLTVRPGATVETIYSINCISTIGTLNVYIGLGGTNVDNSISYSLDGGAVTAALTNFDMAFDLTVGQHTFALSNVAGNCTDPNGLSRTDTVQSGTTTYVQFQITCS